MVRNCVENFQLKILSEFKLNKLSRQYLGWCWMDGWMDGRKEGWESRVKDCLQQLKKMKRVSDFKLEIDDRLYLFL